MALHGIPNPGNMQWEQWVDTVAGYNKFQTITVPYFSEDLWRALADALTLSEPLTPRHESFDNWQDWAYALMDCFPN